MDTEGLAAEPDGCHHALLGGPEPSVGIPLSHMETVLLSTVFLGAVKAPAP